MTDGQTRSDNAREHAHALGFDPDDLFRPNLDAEIDSTRTWVDDNGYRLSDRLWLGKDADRGAIDTVLRQGLAAGDGVAGMSSRLREHLNPDTPGGNYAARRLARTETTRAFGAASIEAGKANPFTKGMKWALSGSHTEPDECNDNASRSSKSLPHGEYTFDEIPRYPAHPNCFPANVLVCGSTIVASMSRWFTGEIVEIVVASGSVLAATENHPILTRRGLVAISELREGDDVVSARWHERIAPSVNDDIHNVPTRIDEVAMTLREARSVSTVEVPVSPEDFHGDGAGSEVSVIRSDRDLLAYFDTAISQVSGEQVFDGRRAEHHALASSGAHDLRLDRVSSAAPSGVRERRDALALIRTHARVRESDRLGNTASRDAAGVESLVDRGPTDTERLRDVFHRLAAEIAIDYVVSVKRYAFSGHVYNLQTTAGMYIANSIVVGNCLCNLSPIMIGDEEFWSHIRDQFSPDEQAATPYRAAYDAETSQRLAVQPFVDRVQVAEHKDWFSSPESPFAQYADNQQARDAMEQAFLEKDRPDATDKVIPIDESPWVGTQNYVAKMGTQRYIDDPDATPTSHALVFRSGGENYLLDGHHRFIAHRVRGEQVFRSVFLDLDALP